ncbi:hypothetical protein [Desulfotomaculum copahuensis]|uniref:Uncharacterized protein n=1 Tax=Desulfotomaculum copahuensis TaxID=1838280 RepID=A0A1B7LDU3_9FIRM|nr:hypothetical protein [Desulfotomaculum copahuensis]OAT81278.1 hypothetical protein A6M21_00330 [Desulfotomaculum copahuensis]
MPWVIAFAIGWLLFFAFLDRRRIWAALAGGLVAVALQLVVDGISLHLDLYRVHHPVLTLLGSSVFFTFGPTITVGALFGQCLPVNRWWQGINILVFAGLFLMEEHMLMLTGSLGYTRWCHGASFYVNVLVFTFITWVVDSLRTLAPELFRRSVSKETG